eukprot:854813-Prorocentrum_minimum.AAC.1
MCDTHLQLVAALHAEGLEPQTIQPHLQAKPAVPIGEFAGRGGEFAGRGGEFAGRGDEFAGRGVNLPRTGAAHFDQIGNEKLTNPFLVHFELSESPAEPLLTPC